MKPILSFLNIFDRKLDDLRKRIKKEFEKPKKERSKQELKRLLHDARKLRHAIKDAKKGTSKKCPHCGGEI